MYSYAIVGAIAIVVTAAVVVTAVMVTQMQSGGGSSDDDSGPVPTSAGTKAKMTYYSSYPACCPNSPNYSPSADKTECADYSGCAYIGQFAAIGQKSYSYVQTHNLVAFYDNADPTGKNFQKNYGGKSINIAKICNGKTYNFTSIIADTCGNSDCDNCCAQNADKTTGFLIDMEYNTVINNFGTTACASGAVVFTIL